MEETPDESKWLTGEGGAQAAAAAVRQEAAAAEAALEAELDALREGNMRANAQLREATLARSAPAAARAKGAASPLPHCCMPSGSLAALRLKV